MILPNSPVHSRTLYQSAEANEGELGNGERDRNVGVFRYASGRKLCYSVIFSPTKIIYALGKKKL